MIAYRCHESTKRSKEGSSYCPKCEKSTVRLKEVSLNGIKQSQKWAYQRPY